MHLKHKIELLPIQDACSFVNPFISLANCGIRTPEYAKLIPTCTIGLNEIILDRICNKIKQNVAN